MLATARAASDPFLFLNSGKSSQAWVWWIPRIPQLIVFSINHFRLELSYPFQESRKQQFSMYFPSRAVNAADDNYMIHIHTAELPFREKWGKNSFPRCSWWSDTHPFGESILLKEYSTGSSPPRRLCTWYVLTLDRRLCARNKYVGGSCRQKRPS